MKKQNLKFRPIKKSELLYLGDGFFANGHWLFSADWLAGLSSRVTMGLRKALQRKQLEIVTARLQGNADQPNYRSRELSKIVARFSFGPVNYSRVELSEKTISKQIGFLNQRELEKGVTAFIIHNHAHKIGIAPDYFAALTFDNDVNIFVATATDPVIMKKNNVVIGMIMPMHLNEGNK